jgi:hypothetical protein
MNIYRLHIFLAENEKYFSRGKIFKEGVIAWQNVEKKL